MTAKTLLVMIFFVVFIMTGCSPATPADIEVQETPEIAAESNEEEEGSVSAVADTPEMRGQQLFVTSYPEVGFACASCHYVTDARLIGPGMQGIAERFEDYDYDGSLEQYIVLSILNPAEYVVENTPAYPANVMPATYRQLFDDSQVDDLVAYILSL